MSTPTLTAVSFSYESAAIATGLSTDVIRRAVRMGDLGVKYVQIQGRTIAKPVIERAELERWIAAGKDEHTPERGAA